MKRIVLFFLYILIFKVGYSQQSIESSLKELKSVINKQPSYDSIKQNSIDSIKYELIANATHVQETYANYAALYEAYKIYKYDSAYSYALRMLETAEQLGDANLITYTKLKLSFTFLSSGMYKETGESLSHIQAATLPDSLKVLYYAFLGRYYYDLGDYDNDKHHTPNYNKLAAQYIDSALALWQPNSYEYAYYKGLRELKSGNKDKAVQYFTALLNRPTLTLHQVAVTASTLSDFYIQKGQNDRAIELLIKATIADIKSSTKETSAAFILASLLYKKGDVKNASLCIEQAISDAAFYGARQRKVQVSEILPLIEAEKISMVESQQKILISYAAVVTVLLLVVVGLVILVSKQVKKLKLAQEVISKAHEKEQAINKQLAETNDKLSDANKIKEEYIGFFFNINAAFYDKIEKIKKNVEKKIQERRLDEVKMVFNTINLKSEKEALLNSFDHAFLKLFPNFVPVFNSLFKEEDQVRLAEGELMNTDLRIFALIRMGIHDTEKIAQILQYSVNTINTYKTKIKNKSIVPNEEFEKRIMAIKAV
ncbi:hypothetical protein LX64_04603 [Chitinophaga skermanii]|uniref:DUF6377 domain-containing protein n=1 Tax=Chitinophaga skermanii TaxID=331697 RepID=A0A327Q4W2_9BACT|nr:DUF6377 domain-containing protein [Chitinophaga skermanii]RAI99469.1 hypothetical protein LX64_04603 [Chitinophaga skermanii]